MNNTDEVSEMYGKTISENKSPLKALRVLILKDNPCDGRMIIYELVKAGIELKAKCVDTETAFIEALDEFSPELIISDYELSMYDGALACSEAKARCPETPFILVVGTLTEKRAVEIFGRGTIYCVYKDQLEDLVPLVKIVLRKSSILNTSKKFPNRLRHALSEPVSHGLSQKLSQNGF